MTTTETHAPVYTQPALFPEDAVTGTGRPSPWPLPEIRVTHRPAAVQQSEELPFAEGTEDQEVGQ